MYILSGADFNISVAAILIVAAQLRMWAACGRCEALLLCRNKNLRVNENTRAISVFCTAYIPIPSTTLWMHPRSPLTRCRLRPLMAAADEAVTEEWSRTIRKAVKNIHSSRESSFFKVSCRWRCSSSGTGRPVAPSQIRVCGAAALPHI